MIGGIYLRSAKHLRFESFDAVSKEKRALVILDRTGDGVRFVTFSRLHLHDAWRGVHVLTSRNISNITFLDTHITRMGSDGINLNDYAGDRFSFLRGSITHTGQHPEKYGRHGIYASGGHGHVFDGIRFKNNDGGQGISVRRGDTTIRNCRFDGPGTAIGFFNEDEDIPEDRGLCIRIYRNIFHSNRIGFYQGGNNDKGIDDPGTTILLYNNTFIGGRAIAQGGSTSLARFYDIYIRNNAFIDSGVGQHEPVGKHIHVWSHNAWWKSKGVRGTNNLEQNPLLDESLSIQSPAFRGRGSAKIAPGVVLTEFEGQAPDIGAAVR